MIGLQDRYNADPMYMYIYKLLIVFNWIFILFFY